MTKEEVHKEFGEPTSTSNFFALVDDYDDISFIGLSGNLSISYDDEDRIDIIFWKYEFNDGEDLSDYSKQIDKIKEYFTENYGTPSEAIKNTFEWSISDKQTIYLRLDSAIEIEYPGQ